MTRGFRMLRGASRALVAEAALVALVSMLALSCASTPRQGAQTPDQRLIAKGQEAWNSKGPEAARQYWSALTDSTSKKAYVGYIDRHAKLVTDLDAAAAMGVDDPARLVAAFDGAEKTFTSFPSELRLPSDTKARAVAAATDRSRALLDARRVSQARELAQSALSAFGEAKELAAVVKEAETLLDSQKDEAGADAVLAKARGRDDFYAKIDGYQDAIAAYAKVKADLATQAGAIGASDSKAVAAASGRLEKKRQDARIEMERRLRERQYSFKDRIGEEFARVPEGDKLGSMSLEEILAYQEGIKSNVEKDYQEMKDFGDKFPAVIDKDMLKDVEDQKNALDKRIAQVQAEIRTAKDIASRGKTVMPVMIGLFNPQPGGKQGDQKSRPAAFRGKTSSGPDYWWGMAAIPKGTMNDLVIEVSDGRTVRAFAENTKSGARVGQPGVKDLVNKGYKMGNMWPVLNAGNQLGSGNYFFEVQGGAKPSYEGEVVIYSSFIARMR